MSDIRVNMWVDVPEDDHTEVFAAMEQAGLKMVSFLDAMSIPFDAVGVQADAMLSVLGRKE